MPNLKDLTISIVNNSIEEIKKFVDDFKFERYNYFDVKILNYKKEDRWFINHIRIDFTKESNNKNICFKSKQENLLFIEESINFDSFLNKIKKNDEGVFYENNDNQLYIGYGIIGINVDKIKAGLRDFTSFHSINADSKIKFVYWHNLYDGSHTNSFFINEKFFNPGNGTLIPANEFYKDNMKLNLGINLESYLLLLFPIYSFSLDNQIVENDNEKYIEINRSISPELKDSIEIYYKIGNNDESILKEKIPLDKEFHGFVKLFVYWYGDDEFIKKGTELYFEEILVKPPMNEILQEIDDVDKDLFENSFIIRKYNDVKLSLEKENLIDCLNSLHQISEKLNLEKIIQWINSELRGYEGRPIEELPKYREFKAKLVWQGTDVPERLHWNLFLPLSEIISKIENEENVERIVDTNILDAEFGRYFVGITYAVIDHNQLKQITTGVLEKIGKIYDFLKLKIKVIEKEISKVIKIKILELDFNEYNLPDYNKFRDLINKIANYNEDFDKILPILLRTLFENLLREIFISSIANKHRYFYSEQGRVRGFSELIAVFNILKDNFFVSNYGTPIPQQVITELNRFKDMGNYNVHEILPDITPNFLEKEKSSIELIVNNLIQLYRRILAGKRNITIKDIDIINKIHKKLNIKKIESEKKKFSLRFWKRK